MAFYLAQLVNSIRVNRRQANFIDAVTHELKSPIASLRLGLETMSRRKLSTEDMNKFTRAMKKDVHRLDRLVSHLLDAAGLNVATDDLGSEIFDVREVIQECILEVCTYHQFPETNIILSEEPILHFGPVQDFEIIFRNLVDNAVKYCGDPPRITIEGELLAGAGTANRIMVIGIENNGASVPESEKKRVFERFERTGIELERMKPGVGLGLFIVRMLLQRNRGKIEIQTPKGGEGTRIHVEIPVQNLPAEEDDSADSWKGQQVG